MPEKPHHNNPTAATAEAQHNRRYHLSMLHARHYIRVAEQAQQQFVGGGEGARTALDRFDLERAQLEAGRMWLSKHVGDPKADKLLVDDANATIHIGHLRYTKQTERIPQWTRAIDAAQRIENRGAQGAFLGNLGLDYAALGDTNNAIDCYRQRFTIARAIGDRRGEATVLGNLGSAYAALGDIRRAIDCYEQQFVVARELGDQRGFEAALGNMGCAYFALGEIKRAEAFHLLALGTSRQIGDSIAEAQNLGNLGNIYYVQREIRRAVECYQQHLSLARTLGDRRGESTALGNLGNAYDTLGERQLAVESYQQHLALAHDIGDRRSEGAALTNLGNLYLAQGEVTKAIGYYQQSLSLTRAIGDRHGEATALSNLGNAYDTLGERQLAVESYHQTLSLARAIGDLRAEGVTLCNLGNIHAALGDLQPALELYQQYLSTTRKLGDRYGEGIALGNLGNVYDMLGERQRAAEYYQQHLALARATGDRHSEGVALGNLGIVYAGLGEVQRAIELYQQRLTIAREIGDRRGVVTTSWNYGLALARLGKLDEALALLESSAASYQDTNQPRAAEAKAIIEHIRQHGMLPEADGRSQSLSLTLPVTSVISRGDGPARSDSFDAHPTPEDRRLAAETPPVAQSDPAPAKLSSQIDQALLQMLPLLGDIALAAHGDVTARQIAQATLPALEQHPWQVTNAIQRIWAGERDAAALVEGIEPNSAALVQRILRLVADGPTMIVAAFSLRLTYLRRQADGAFAYARTADDAQIRDRVVTQLSEIAQSVAEWPGAPGHELAAHLRDLAARLRSEGDA